MEFIKRSTTREYQRNGDMIGIQSVISGRGSGTTSITTPSRGNGGTDTSELNKIFLPAKLDLDGNYTVVKSIVTFTDKVVAEIEKYEKHIKDKILHITAEEREKWNNYNVNITALESKVSGHTSSISSINSDISSLSSSISSLSSDISSLSSSISSLSSSISSLESRVSALESAPAPETKP